MARSISLREKGKIRLSEYFKELKPGEKVAITINLSENPQFPKRIQGRTGIVEEKRGKAYVVRVKEYNSEKRHLIKPIHLKRLK
jgi:ribosomal protein L21E